MGGSRATTEATAPSEPRVVAVLVGFARALRAEGLVVGSGQVVRYAEAVTALDPADSTDVYWAGRACLLARHQDLANYDRVFRRYFGAETGGLAMKVTGALARPSLNLAPVLAPPAAERDVDDGARGDQGERVGARASSADMLRHKRFADCTADELVQLQILMARLRLTPPRRQARRRVPAAKGGDLDLRRTMRRSLRSDGELVRRSWRAPRHRHRRVVLLLDVSASMAACSRALLQFSHSAASALRPPAEVFCFGTRLTRVTRELRHRRPDQALAGATASVVDWEGGTRIGESLATFIRVWGRRGTARGSVVVICSDGLERGDPAVLAREMARLARLAHRIVWINPLKGDPRYQPLARGMSAALPFIDVFVSGHDLASLEAFAALLPELT